MRNHPYLSYACTPQKDERIVKMAGGPFKGKELLIVVRNGEKLAIGVLCPRPNSRTTEAVLPREFNPIRLSLHPASDDNRLDLERVTQVTNTTYLEPFARPIPLFALNYGPQCEEILR